MSLGYNKENVKIHLPLAILFLFVFLGATEPEENAPEENLFEAKILEKVLALEASISNLSHKINEIDKRLTKLEKAPPPQQIPQKAQEPASPIIKPLLEEKIKSPSVDLDIGHGFRGINVHYESSFSDTLFTGEIENNTGDREFVHFHVEAYDDKGKIVGKGGFQFIRLTMGSREHFELVIRGLNAKDIARYSITCVRGF